LLLGAQDSGDFPSATANSVGSKSERGPKTLFLCTAGAAYLFREIGVQELNDIVCRDFLLACICPDGGAFFHAGFLQVSAQNLD